MKIDAHQHFWHYRPEEFGWIDDAMSAIKRDFLPNDLAPLLQATGMDGSVVVQARQTLEETEWLLQLADQYPFIKGVVGWVDLRHPRVEEQLERFNAHPKFVGVRHIVHDEPDDQFMLLPEFIRGLRTLGRFDLTYDILIFPRHLSVAHEVVRMFPDQPFVLDHIAKPFIKDGIIAPWDDGLRQLAAFPNVTCKLSGMVTEANWHGWQPADFRPYLDIVLEAFGPHRLMIGSDWPVCTVAGTYAEVVGIVFDYVRALSADEQAAILGGNAQSFYKLAEE